MSSCSTTNSAATVEDTTGEPTTELLGELDLQAVADPGVSVADDEDGDSEPEAEPIAASAETSGDGDAAPETASALAQKLEELVLSVGLVEELSRQAREAASCDLATYDALLASHLQYATQLEQACAIRDQASEAHDRAFGQEARNAAEPILADAERIAQAFAHLSSAWQERASAFVNQHPDIQLLIDERDNQAELARQKEVQAAHHLRLQALITACDGAIRQGILREGRRLVDAIDAEFPEQTTVRDQLRLALQRRERADKDEAARQALASCAEYQARGDLEGAVNVLEQVDVQGLSVEVSQDVFGRWSDVCSRHAQLSGTTLYRFAPAQGRGVILYADPAYPNGLIVFSALGMGAGLKQGKVVTDFAILRRARTFREASPLPMASWATSGPATPSTTQTPVRH